MVHPEFQETFGKLDEKCADETKNTWQTVSHERKEIVEHMKRLCVRRFRRRRHWHHHVQHIASASSAETNHNILLITILVAKIVCATKWLYDDTTRYDQLITFLHNNFIHLIFLLLPSLSFPSFQFFSIQHRFCVSFPDSPSLLVSFLGCFMRSLNARGALRMLFMHALKYITEHRIPLLYYYTFIIIIIYNEKMLLC